MVIARVAGYINKKPEIRACSGISGLFVVGATHRNDHDIYIILCGLQVLFGACNRESNPALVKQEDITNRK
jgi:hypothetical protein